MKKKYVLDVPDKPAEQSSESSEESEEEVKPTKRKKPVKKVQQESSSEEEAPRKKRVPPKRAPPKRAPSKRKKKEESSEEEESSDSSESEEEPVKNRRAPPRGPAVPKPAPSKEEKFEEQKEGGRKEKIVVKGRAAVDKLCKIGSSVHVLEESGDQIWNCMLNQTNIKNNNNKFYVIQLLEGDSSKSFHCFTRWGRVGENGQHALKSCDSLEDAKIDFKKKI